MLDWFLELLQKFAQVILDALPHSPVKQILREIGQPEWLGYLNWFVPVSAIINLLIIFGSAITIYYLYQIILRWVKAID